MSGIMKKYIPVHEGRLYCESKGSGEPLVFIHGFSLDTRMWEDQFEYFGSSYMAIRYDVRGFGKSSIPRSTYSHAEDLAVMLQHLGIRRASLVGLSMGGAIALNFASAYPRMTGRMVLADSSIGAIQPSREAVSFGKRNTSPLERELFVGEVKSLWLSDDIFKPAFEDEGLKRRIIDMVMDYSGYHWLHENPVGRCDERYIDGIRRISSPVLIILGSRDVPKHRTIAEFLLANIPGATLARLQGAGHMCNMERPAEFNREVMDFLSRHRQ
jgi:3-oxoadipate enol-lactonase